MIENRLADLAQFYRLLTVLEDRIGGKRILAECHGRMQWPRCGGVYFFFEQGEFRSDSGHGERVVRVGRTARPIWSRLYNHRGTARGEGNHRSSIFRELVGLSIKERDHMNSPLSWSIGLSPGTAARRFNTTTEKIRSDESELERLVSSHIGSMSFIWLPIGNESKREQIERNAISLLFSSESDRLDSPSITWLGLHCPKAIMRESGLWNAAYVGSRRDPAFLGLLGSSVHDFNSLH
jgi:hypothetical protein